MGHAPFFRPPKYVILVFLSPPNEFEQGTMKRAPYVCVSVCPCVCVSVCVCVCMCVRAMFNLLLLCHLWTDFDSVCFIWKHYIGASKLLHWFSPVTFDLYFIFCYKMLLLRHFWPDFDSVCFMWQLLIFVLYCLFCYFFAISDPISILFALCVSTRW